MSKWPLEQFLVPYTQTHDMSFYMDHLFLVMANKTAVGCPQKPLH